MQGDILLKKAGFLFITIILSLSATSCVRSGEKDSTDFFGEMLRRGYICNIIETQSGNSIKESCYIDDFKISAFSDSDGALMRVSLTYSQGDSDGFSELAEDVVGSFCGFDSEQIKAVFLQLDIGSELPADSSGVKRCDTQWYGFAFTCDKTGGTLVVENYRISPTSAPEVTLNTTVPFVSFPSSE